MATSIFATESFLHIRRDSICFLQINYHKSEELATAAAAAVERARRRWQMLTLHLLDFSRLLNRLEMFSRSLEPELNFD